MAGAADLALSMLVDTSTNGLDSRFPARLGVLSRQIQASIGSNEQKKNQCHTQLFNMIMLV